jgi:hypothetical protein
VNAQHDVLALTEPNLGAGNPAIDGGCLGRAATDPYAGRCNVQVKRRTGQGEQLMPSLNHRPRRSAARHKTPKHKRAADRDAAFDELTP